VRLGLEVALPGILPLRNHSDPDIADFACRIADELASTNPSVKEQIDADRPSASDFYSAVAQFTAFVVRQGYPPNLLWVKPADVVIHKWDGEWAYFVWKGDPSDRERDARRDYQGAASHGVGLELTAHCKTERWAICHILVPVDENQRERLMVPKTGIKQSAVDNPLRAVLVENKWKWTVLKWLARKSPSVWE